MIHLDTSFLIQAMVTGSAAEATLQTWLASGEDLAISSIALSEDRKSTRLNSSPSQISYAVFGLEKNRVPRPGRPATARTNPRSPRPHPQPDAAGSPRHTRQPPRNYLPPL